MNSSPKIVTFCCAGSGAYVVDYIKKLDQGQIEVIEVPCAGRIEAYSFLEPLRNGADAVFVVACHEENCEHLWGNVRAKKRIEYLAAKLGMIGVVKERFAFFNVSTNGGVRLLKEMTEKVSKLKQVNL